MTPSRILALAALAALAFGSAAVAAEAPSTQKTGADKKVAKPMAAIDPAIAMVRTYIADSAIDKSKPDWKTRLPMFPDLKFTEGKTYLWQLDTNMGPITITFLPKAAPRHVSNFVYLTELGYFDGIVFHRVIPGFMAQGGDPLGKGFGGPGYKFAGELDPSAKHDKPGKLSMANSGPGTDGSQFFITFVPTPFLDGKHTVFGEVTSGMDTVKELEERGSPGQGVPTERLVINTAKIVVQ